MKKLLLLLLLVFTSCYEIVPTDNERYFDRYYTVISISSYANDCEYNLNLNSGEDDYVKGLQIIENCGKYNVGDRVKFTTALDTITRK